MTGSGVVGTGKAIWHRLRDRTNAYLANDDPLAAAANAGAFLVWGNQPFYPLYVWLLVGHDAWPSVLTWLSTPAFVAVPIVARRRSILGRSVFVVAGIVNTLLSAKAFGLETDVAWFLLPCLVLTIGFFRMSEWKIGASLTAVTLLAGAATPYLGAPLHKYDAQQARSLSHLNLWSVSVLTLYLAYAAIRARREHVALKGLGASPSAPTPSRDSQGLPKSP